MDGADDMALLCANGTRTASGPNRMFSGVTTVAGGHRRENIAVPHTHLNFAAGEHAISGVTDRSSVPQGARHPVAYKWPRKTGGLASHNASIIEFTGAGSGALGRNIAGDTTVTWTLPDAQLQLVVSAQGTAAIEVTVGANLAGALFAEGATSFEFTVPDALLGAIAGLTGASAVEFSSTATIRAEGWMEGNITPFTELSPESLASAVWNAAASEFNATGTMGEKLNDAGSASNPWTEVIESGLTAAEILRLIVAAVAGKSARADLGGGVLEITYRDLADSKDRIVAETNSSNERTSVTRDGT
jgi:hypothetical protein